MATQKKKLGYCVHKHLLVKALAFTGSSRYGRRLLEFDAAQIYRIQLGFRQGKRMEEHLLTANVCLQKTLAANTPLWIISLDLSKAFDKVDWNAPWTALRQHGTSEHLIWILQAVYFGQTGVVREHDTDSCGFNFRGGVRQGCVLSPRSFSSVLKMAVSSWRAKMEAEGLSLEDGLTPLLDLHGFTVCR